MYEYIVGRPQTCEMPCSTTKPVRKTVNNLICTEVNVKKGEIFETTIAWYCDVDGPALLKLCWYTFATYKGILTNKPDMPTKNSFSQMLLKYQRILTTLCNWSAISATHSDCWEWFLQSRLSAQLFPLPQHLCCSNAVLFLFVTYKYSIMVLIVFAIYIC